jgi:DNA-directed RNA polymerase II subunit RPB1
MYNELTSSSIPQTTEARTELQELMAVSKKIRGSQKNCNTMGIFQDSLSSAFLLTSANVFLKREEAMDLVMQMSKPVYNIDGSLRNGPQLPIPAILKPEPLWTGKQIISMMIPQSLFVEKRVRKLDSWDWMDPEERCVVVMKGELLSGSLCKDTLGEKEGSIIDVMCLDAEQGSTAACNFMTDIQRVTNKYLMYRGLSVGIADITMSEATKQEVREAIQKTNNLVNAVNTVKLTGVSSQEKENYIRSMQNNLFDQMGRIVHAKMPVGKNTVRMMAYSGSKGNDINSTQLAAGVGQQSIEGKRPSTTGNFDRTLPSCKRKENTAKSRGFIENSFTTGLKPGEFYFHAMSGREGTIDTVVKTAETGYIQRRLLKAMESMSVQYDGTVRNADGHIVEFGYGTDGMKGECIEKVSCPVLKMNNKQVYENLCHIEENDLLSLGLTEKQIEGFTTAIDYECSMIIQYRDLVRKSKVTLHTPILDEKVFIPINVERMINRIVHSLRTEKRHLSDLTPDYIVLSVDKLCEDIRNAVPSCVGVQSVTLSLRSHMTCKKLMFEHLFTQYEFDNMCQNILYRFRNSIIEPGTSVGALTSESLGEPATQMVSLFITHINSNSCRHWIQ